jgi:aldose sugar dehydrogenase
MKLLISAATVLAISLSLACSKAPTGKGAGEIATASGGAGSNGNTGQPSNGLVRFRVETVASNLEVPWSIVFTPEGRMLFTERPGRVRVIENGNLRAEPLITIPEVAAASESGLMGMTLHPRFAENRWLYLAYAYRGGGGQRVRVVRYRETGSALVEPKTIIEEIPAAPNHAGCRLGFGPDGKLYITTGDATQRGLAQRLDSLAGKTLRLNDDGSTLADNPFVNQPGARPEIWSYGHRNAQGIDWQPGTGLMFQTEHGPSGFDGPGGGDEVNTVERGKNYGWPVVHHRDTREGMEPPLLEYTPAVAPASGMFYRGAAFPDFQGNFFFGCLKGKCIIRVVLDERRVISQERLLEDSYGRIREVAEGPDGIIYFSTSNRDGRGSPAAADDRILRLVPVK